jgi:bifunctional non-homologous end joining protein LigD
MADLTWIVDKRRLQMTNADKAVWTEPYTFTKLQVLNYYRTIAPLMLRYMRDRPVTVRVFPRGVTGDPGYYQRDKRNTTPDWIPSVDYRTSSTDKTSRLLIIDTSAGILWFVNKGAIEFHTWSCSAGSFLSPDQAVIDLDPGERATFEHVLDAAALIHEELEKRENVASFPKTSGGRGMHIHIPLAPVFSYEQIHSWIGGIAERLSRSHPHLIAAPHAGSTHRGDHITVDNGQNALGKNTATPYTLRANRRGPVVSTPLTWEEVAGKNLSPEMFTPESVLERAKERGDVFTGMMDCKQKPAALLAR